MREIKTVGIAGTGVIGAGWAARFLAHGLDVVAWDPAPDAEDKLRAAVQNAWPALSKLGLFPGADQKRLRFTSALDEMAGQADFIQESAPERLDLKTGLHRDLDNTAAEDVIIASSTSGLLPSDFQSKCQNPERIIVGHPFNPVYLLPLVEIVGGKKSGEAALKSATEFYTHMGMKPLRLKKEVEGFLSDRLQEALWRENLHIINDGYASTGDLDDAIRYGPGLRWAMMGTNYAFYLAGGDQGMRHFLKQFGPALKLPWTKLEAPELTDELIDKMVEGTEEQAAGKTVKELEQLRDNCLIAVMQALRSFDVGAGKIYNENENRRIATAQEMAPWSAGDDIPAPLIQYRTPVLSEWVDYNKHMTESAYLLAIGWAADALYRFIGNDDANRKEGYSLYTAETHLNHFREAGIGDSISVTTQVLNCDEKRLHVFFAMNNEETGTLLCTAEQMILYVDMEQGRAVAMPENIQQAALAVTKAHAHLPVPEQVGRQMKIVRK
jgi:carnitine 3-dehydrogenase